MIISKDVRELASVIFLLLVINLWYLTHGIFADRGGLVPTQEKKIYGIRELLNDLSLEF